jgi:DNA-binding response OmpR family regulator/anti-sigma regulatory factor (Ser/Thr protein kinase)
VESGHAELLCSTFDVSKVLQDTQTIIKTLANKKSIDLQFNIPASLPPLFADEAKFKQILFNLLSNAIKFTPDRGKVSVTASLVPGESLKISVADSGIGIKPQDHDRIFHEFEQVDSSYGRQQQGTGLGLALTKRLVEMHGGQISLESEGIEGRGSVFTFVIPIRKPEARPARPAAAPGLQDDALRPHILVLRTRNSTEQLVDDYLISAGYEVSVAADPAALPGALNSQKPYAVIVHANNPRGAELKELLGYRSQIPSSIPFLIFSLNGDEMPQFRSVTGARTMTAHRRLSDAVRGSQTSSDKELKTVLIIDDEPALLELLGLLLVNKGFRVLRANDGRAGIETARTQHPDIVVLDLAIPDLNGAQVVERLRADPQTRRIPVLIHTGMALSEDERHHLATQVQSITFKTEQDSLLAELDRLGESADNLPELESSI